MIPQAPQAGHGKGGLEVEIGCGNGHFLAEYGARKPDTRLVGIDIKNKRCLKAREKAEKRGLRNITIIHGEAEEYLESSPRSSVDAVHIYFPDPWPKSRHRKRRFFTMDRLRQIHDLLVDGGRLFFGTDFFDYYIQAKVLVALHPGMRLIDEPPPAEILSSLYSQKASEASKSIYLLCAAKCGESQKSAG